VRFSVCGSRDENPSTENRKPKTENRIMTTQKDYKRILIVEVNWIGDVLFSTPLIRAVRERYPDAYIACMVAPRVKPILEGNPRVNKIIVYDERGRHKSIIGKLRLISLLRRKRFDCAILLHRSSTKALLTFFGGAKERIGYVTRKRRALLTVPVEPPEGDMHKVDYFLKLASAIGCDISNKDYEFFVPDAKRRYIASLLSESGIGADDLLVVLNPGGNWQPKRWIEEHFAALADSLIAGYGAKVVISGALKDRARALRIKGMMKKGDAAVLSGVTDMKQLGALLERADFVISGDSGPMHIAVAMKASTIALFGPTSPSLTGPYGSGSYKVIQKSTGCTIPCYDVTCDAPRCMEAISVEDVLRVFDEMYRAGQTKGLKGPCRQ
jgi:heptosyltransferase-2